ncbi:MAG: osmoprotectant transport system permease protein [Actinomycetota bacterium]|nr:osmoprotectant transport system permease protein [Actinomycetota bacterium]MDQ1643616.1 osmoprotectant transport system permease protein [Actinomycetota bacterium]
MASLLAQDQPSNPWFTWDYVANNRQDILSALEQHVTLTVETILIALLLSFPLALLAYRYRRLAGPVLALTGVLYTIPSLSLFAFLAPFTGLRARTVLIGLVMYALLILVRNILAGLDGVPDEVREAALGMGYGRGRMLLSVELPVALPTIMAGVRVATVSTIALITVGVIVGYGGLGGLLLAGFQNNFYHAEILTASLLTVALGLTADLLLAGVTRVLTPWARSRS